MALQTRDIATSVDGIIKTIPSHVILLAAPKTSSLEEAEAVIHAGVTHIGYNYVQEASPIIQVIGSRATWHMIGHLQKNKAKTAIQQFEMIETVDSWSLAQTSLELVPNFLVSSIQRKIDAEVDHDKEWDHHL